MKWRLKNKGKGSKGIRYFKLRYSSVLTSSGGGIIASYMSAKPDAVWDGGGTVEDWSSVSSLFDSFQTRAMKMHFIPQLPNDTSAQTGYFPLYVGFDVDAQAVNPVGSVSAALQYENMKVFNMYRPWKYYKILPRTGASKQLGWTDMANTSDQYGMIWTFGEGFDVSQTYGRVILTLYIKAKDRR